MKLIYIYRGWGDINSGVNKKIAAQVRSLSETGLESTIFPIINKGNNHSLQCIDRYKVIPPIKKILSVLESVIREYRINQNLDQLISSLDSGDIIYLRIIYPSPQLSMILRKPRRCKIVIEYQTIESLEYRLKRKYWYLLIDALFGDDLRKYTDAIVGVTEEITWYELKRAGNDNKPHITIGNGFDVESVPVKRSDTFSGKEIHLLCVAHVNKWHGLDRLLKGIAAYNGETKIIFHIAGDGAEITSLIQLSEELGIENQVIFHGFKSGAALDVLFDMCHVGVGSLAIHRKGLTHTSELKAREYCARGIPYIIACGDTDFPDDFPFVHLISPDESPVDVRKVISFVQKVYEEEDHPGKMRGYATMNLDWSVKMKKLKKFLENQIV